MSRAHWPGDRHPAPRGADAPTRRVVLLGASNLTRSFATAVATAQQTWGEPLEIMAAMGHGRSYGQDSSVLGRKIPGIFPCALWQELDRRRPLPTAAILTDIGNDLLYGEPPERIVDWVARCVDRLIAADATIVVTQLPTESIERLSERRFRFFRRLWFPRSNLTLPKAVALAQQLNEQLLQLGEQREIPVISVSSAWYGLDSIHLRRRVWREAWQALVAEWRAAAPAVAPARPSLWTSLYLATLAPRERSFFGFRQCAAQPSGRLPDGTTISLY